MRLGFVIPCFNEEEVLTDTARQLLALLDDLHTRDRLDAQSFICFVDDGSTDRTWHVIKTLATSEPRVRGIKLSGNFGHQSALLAGLLSVDGDAVVSMDADLQDDAHAVEDMLEKVQNGADIVYGVRRNRGRDTFVKRTTARAFYGFMRSMDVRIIPDHGEFRLMSRRAIEALRGYNEVNMFLRGVVPHLGFTSAEVSYDRGVRAAGLSKYPFRKMVELALAGITSFSVMPLRFIAISGAILAFISAVFGFWALGVRVFTSASTVPGWASIIILLAFLGGLQLLALGIVGEYVGRIYMEVKRRPRFIVEEQINFARGAMVER